MYHIELCLDMFCGPRLMIHLGCKDWHGAGVEVQVVAGALVR